VLSSALHLLQGTGGCCDRRRAAARRAGRAPLHSLRPSLQSRPPPAVCRNHDCCCRRMKPLAASAGGRGCQRHHPTARATTHFVTRPSAASTSADPPAIASRSSSYGVGEVVAFISVLTIECGRCCQGSDPSLATRFAWAVCGKALSHLDQPQGDAHPPPRRLLGAIIFSTILPHGWPRAAGPAKP
jgi:hypothetical protein